MKQTFPKNLKRIRKTAARLMYTALLILFSSTFLTGCGKEKEAFTKTDFCFDTVISVTVYDKANNKTEAEKILTEALSLCQQYDSLLSRTRENSDIYRINHAEGNWTTVSEETSGLIYTALNYCELSDGLIDITIAPVSELWMFNLENDENAIPSGYLLEQALSHVDYSCVEINGNAVCLHDPNAAIDLGFIAKGYVADKVKAYLISADVKHALINLGGNILTVGDKPDGSPFKIGIQKPFAEKGTYITTVETGNNKKDCYSSVVTSGIYERCFTLSNTLYHHILDPKTGYPLRTDLNSVTILTESSTQADALSTTCLVLGLDAGKELIDSLDGVEAIFITTDNRLIDTREK